MKRKLSRILLKWAQALNPAIAFENAPKVRQMGITLHITKKDVKDWRKNHPEIKSHRQGLRELIEEAKYRVAGAIGRGLIDKKVIDFEVDKTLYVADVSGIIYLYAHENEPKEEAKSED